MLNSGFAGDPSLLFLKLATINPASCLAYIPSKNKHLEATWTSIIGLGEEAEEKGDTSDEEYAASLSQQDPCIECDTALTLPA